MKLEANQDTLEVEEAAEVEKQRVAEAKSTAADSDVLAKTGMLDPQDEMAVLRLRFFRRLSHQVHFPSKTKFVNIINYDCEG